MNENSATSSFIYPSWPPQLPKGVYGSATLGKLFEALAKAQSEFGIAVFDSKNPHFKNEFASLRSIDDATKKQLTTMGIAVTQILFSDEMGHPHMMTFLGHSSGEYLAGDLKLLLSKNDMQGLGASSTYGRRYCKSAAVNVVSDSDDDGNAASGIATGDQRQQVEREEVRATDQTGPCSEAQAKMIYAKAKSKKIPDDKLKDILIQVSGVRSTHEVPWGDVNEVLNQIAAYRSH